MSQPNTAVATIEPPAKLYPLRSQIASKLQSDAAKAVILPLLPKGVDFDEVLVEVYRAYTVNNDIDKCTTQSIVMAVATAVQTGLRIGKTVYLVPTKTKISRRGEKDEYEDRLQAWTSYIGDIELVVRSGAARHVDGQAVYEGDRFEVTLGTNPDVVHIPVLSASKRGKMIGAYSVAYLNGLGTLKKVTWVPLEDVEKIRKNSKQWGPTKVDVCPDWYAIKTAIHRNCKLLPKNEKLAKVLALFDRQAAEDRGDETFDELPLGLDPAKQIGAASSVGGEEPKAQPGREARATNASIDERAPLDNPSLDSLDSEDEFTPPSETKAATRQRFSVEETLFPFGTSTVGRPLWQISTEDLASGYRFAQKNKRPEHKAFIEAAESVLELRRAGDVPEPTTDELSMPKEPTA